MSSRNGRSSATEELAGTSPAVRELRRQIEALAASDLPLLIEGEAGTGKGLVARVLHRAGPRAERPFIEVRAARLRDDQFERELYGCRPGASSGGADHREGLAGAADGGTLFLDEVGDLSPVAQAKLLRFLDSRAILPLGAGRPLPVDLRIVASTRRDLHAEAHSGRFRTDLYFRLRGLLIRLPALRDRREDMKPLVESFLARFAARHGRPVSTLDPEALELLLGHPWEGNVRELAHEIECAVLATAPGAPIMPASLSLLPDLGELPCEGRARLRAYRRDQERTMIVETLEGLRWNVSAAARRLGLSRVGLSKKIKILGLVRPAPIRTLPLRPHR
ncbi:MAG TPA: sigma 54-interacting transcriptional regulator [Thermoanaerobaculia bacterium]|jgi:DNA-binding NtrC family response regulator